MIAIVDYNAGNLTSVKLACQSLDIDAQITSDPQVIGTAERVIFPGVGAAGAAMSHLRELELAPVLKDVLGNGTPFLGICLGMQVLLQHSDEDDGVDCLGLVNGNVQRFEPSDRMCKIPQIGWNAVSLQQLHPLFEGIEDGSEFYFVHSYYCQPDNDAVVLGRTDYADVEFMSVLAQNNLVATQFHPEKSGRIGLRLLKNFSTWNGQC
jgi:glutamine amidotransferase